MYWVTGKTTKSMHILLQGIKTDYFPFHMHNRNALDLRNQFILLLIWLRRYPTITDLSMHLGISVSAVHEIINNFFAYFT